MDWIKQINKVMDYILAVTNHVDTPECIYVPAPEGMMEFSYPAATWAIINADGKLPNAVQDMQENHQEVWIAIEESDKAL